MEKKPKLTIPLAVIFLLIINDTVDTTAQLLMKSGIHQIFAFSSPHFFISWLGIILYAFNFFIWMKILSRIDLSIALPLASSSYILIPLAAVFFLHEKVHALRWAGLIMIIWGICFISQSKPSKEAAHD